MGPYALSADFPFFALGLAGVGREVRDVDFGVFYNLELVLSVLLGSVRRPDAGGSVAGCFLMGEAGGRPVKRTRRVV